MSALNHRRVILEEKKNHEKKTTKGGRGVKRGKEKRKEKCVSRKCPRPCRKNIGGKAVGEGRKGGGKKEVQ